MHPLVTLANNTIKSIFTKTPVALPEGYDEPRGCFVTITKRGALRGCIGYVTTNKPLAQAVQELARAAAMDDPRFPPLQEQELGSISVEVSVLSKPALIKGEDAAAKRAAFIPGETGLIVQRGWASGLLLPQVFDEETRSEEALAMTCEKAGLPKSAWHDKETKVYTFTAKAYR